MRSRMGWMPEAGRPLVWFHGASAGEMVAASGLAALLRENGFAFTAGYTAANPAGVDLVRRAGGSETAAALAPWDVPRWVGRAFDHWSPSALFLVETEIWPRLIIEAARRSVPVLCVNARIYERDIGRYWAIRRLMRPTLRRVATIVAQNDNERDRFVRLGADPERCLTGGNLKYLALRGRIEGDGSWRRSLGIGSAEGVIVFGSVHRDEVELLLAALQPLAGMNCRVVVAPRHAPVVPRVVSEARRRGWKVSRRTDESGASDWRLLVLDTMGELPQFYSVATVAVVGGGFGKHGGHNPFEPVEVGAPVIFGPHFEHFADEARAITSATPDAQAASAVELGECLRAWLTDEARRRQTITLQRRALPDREAIAKRYLAVLSPWLRGRGLELR